MPIFSTAYFPTINYVSQLVRYGKVKIEIFETYPKQTYRNRTVISTANGILALSVPVEKNNGNHTFTKDVTICNREDWRIKHWRAIQAAYNSSPYFLYYEDDIRNLIFKDFKYLIDLNAEILSCLLKKLKVTTEFSFSEDFLPVGTENDFRNAFSPKVAVPKDTPAYPQVFEERLGFQPNLSILDAIFNLGPETKSYLQGMD